MNTALGLEVSNERVPVGEIEKIITDIKDRSREEGYRRVDKEDGTPLVHTHIAYPGTAVLEYPSTDLQDRHMKPILVPDQVLDALAGLETKEKMLYAENIYIRFMYWQKETYWWLVQYMRAPVREIAQELCTLPLQRLQAECRLPLVVRSGDRDNDVMASGYLPWIEIEASEKGIVLPFIPTDPATREDQRTDLLAIHYIVTKYGKSTLCIGGVWCPMVDIQNFSEQLCELDPLVRERTIDLIISGPLLRTIQESTFGRRTLSEATNSESVRYLTGIAQLVGQMTPKQRIQYVQLIQEAVSLVGTLNVDNSFFDSPRIPYLRSRHSMISQSIETAIELLPLMRELKNLLEESFDLGSVFDNNIIQCNNQKSVALLNIPFALAILQTEGYIREGLSVREVIRVLEITGSLRRAQLRTQIIRYNGILEKGFENRQRRYR